MKMSRQGLTPCSPVRADLNTKERTYFVASSTRVKGPCVDSAELIHHVTRAITGPANGGEGAPYSVPKM